jgi:hypothetical protein
MTDLVERVKQAQAAAIDGLRGEDNLPTFEEEVEVSSKAAIAIVLEEALRKRRRWRECVEIIGIRNPTFTRPPRIIRTSAPT